MIMKRLVRSGALLGALALTAGPVWLAEPADAAGGSIRLSTVPATAGVDLSVGSHVVRTGSDGTASLAVDDLSVVPAQVSLRSTRSTDGGSVSLARVLSQPSGRRGERVVTVGLNIRVPVQLSVDAADSGVRADQVASVRLHSSTGEVLTVDPRAVQRLSLEARRATLQRRRMVARVVTWNVDSVHTDRGTVATRRVSFDPLRLARWTITLARIQGDVLVQTVPPVAGVRLSLDGSLGSTDAAGRVTIASRDLNGVAGRVMLDSPEAGEFRVGIVKTGTVKADRPFTRHVIVGLTVSRQVRVGFVDPHGAHIDARRVSVVTLSNARASGGPIRVDPHAPTWLVSEVARTVGGETAAVPLSYAVHSVRLDDSEAVFTGQQRFSPSTASDWPIRVQVFAVRLKVRDSLSGKPSGRTVVVTAPSGQRSTLRLDADKSVELTSVVRGRYTIEVRPAGMRSVSSLLVSRDDAFEVRVISVRDLVTVAGLTALVFTGLIVTGRRLRPGKERPSPGDGEGDGHGHGDDLDLAPVPGRHARRRGSEST